MLAIGWEGSLGTAKGCIKSFAVGPFLIQIWWIQHFIVSKSHLCSVVICGCRNISFKALSGASGQNLISISLQRLKLFCRTASHGVIADAESESVGLSTLRQNLNAQLCISRTSTASPQKQLQNSALGKCANSPQ